MYMQRHDVVIDACLVGGSHSSLLQQACQLTGGIYTRPARPAVLVEYLLVSLADLEFATLDARAWIIFP